ncbi:TIGR03089 family protein [Propionibacteriaceae bacterium Y1685]
MNFTDLLNRRIRADGARPLLITYDADGNRTELSPISYGNWVAKGANLITDTIDADTGDVIALPLVAAHQGHWMSLVWVGACWTAGIEVRLQPDGDEVATVAGPELDFGDSAAMKYACSLHPLGFGFTTDLPAGVDDWTVEVRGEGDVFAGLTPMADDLAWCGQSLTDVLDTESISDTVLITPETSDPLAVIRTALVGPLLGGGASVVVHGDQPGIADREQARPVILT